MKTIKLSNGGKTIVDDDNYSGLKFVSWTRVNFRNTWTARSGKYAYLNEIN